MSLENGDLRALIAKVIENQEIQAEKQAQETAAIRRELAAVIEGQQRQGRELVDLITNVKESMEREMHAGFARTEVMEIRLNRHAALLQTGARWSARMLAWSEKVDRLLEGHDQRLGAVEDHVRKIIERADRS